MFEVIKNYIDNIPDIPFDEFYQTYIMGVQDRIIDSKVRSAELSLHTIESTCDIINGINMLAEELENIS